jgi:hypothetical protein
MREKNVALSPFTDVVNPIKRFSEKITKDDVLLSSNLKLLYGTMSPADKDSFVLRIPLDRKTRTILPSFKPFPVSMSCEVLCLRRAEKYGHFNPSAPTTWMDVIDHKIAEGKRIWLAVFDPLPELAMSKYNMTFQKSLYDVLPLSSSKNLSGPAHSFGFSGARDVAATVEVKFNGVEGDYVQYVLNYEDQKKNSVRAVWLEPGLNRKDLLFRTLPLNIRFMSKVSEGRVSIQSVDLGIFKHLRYWVFQSTAAGRFVLKLAEPFLDEKMTPSAELRAIRKLIKIPAHPHLPIFYTINPKQPGPTFPHYSAEKS